MAIVLAAAAAAAFLVQPVCSWDRPGVDRYRGTPAAALAHYRDIPAADRAALARRIAAGIPDDTVQITRGGIAGRHQYESAITDMHFGNGRMCRSVTRVKWSAAHREPAAVYCAADECVLVPEVSGNVSRVRIVVTSGSSAPGTTGGAPRIPVELPPMPAAPVAFYPAVPAGGEELPPWAGPGAPLAPPPLPDYPGPGRGIAVPVPLAPVPEPSTWAMWLGGLAFVVGRVCYRARLSVRPRTPGKPATAPATSM